RQPGDRRSGAVYTHGRTVWGGGGAVMDEITGNGRFSIGIPNQDDGARISRQDRVGLQGRNQCDEYSGDPETHSLFYSRRRADCHLGNWSYTTRSKSCFISSWADERSVTNPGG